MRFQFLGNIRTADFAKTNAQGRKRYKRKPGARQPKQPNVETELLIRKNNRDEFKTKVRTVEEGRKWVNTFLNLRKLFGN